MAEQKIAVIQSAATAAQVLTVPPADPGFGQITLVLEFTGGSAPAIAKPTIDNDGRIQDSSTTVAASHVALTSPKALKFGTAPGGTADLIVVVGYGLDTMNRSSQP